jgi:hypothetical protein
MIYRIVGSTCAAALFSFTVVAAQTAAGPDQHAGEARAQHHAEGQQVTFVGCVQREDEFLRDARDASPDLQPTGNDFVLTQVQMAGAGAVGTTGIEEREGHQPGEPQPEQPGVPQPEQPGQAGQPVQPGQSDHAQDRRGDMRADDKVFSLTGERDFEQFVGQRVEVTGTIDAETPVGTTGVGQPGVSPDAQERDRQDWQDRSAADRTPQADEQEIPEITVTAIRPVAGQC